MKYFAETARILLNAMESVDEIQFSNLEKSCLKILENNGKIIVSGFGKNVPICEKFVGTLTSMGISSAFMHTNSAVHGDLGMVRDCDLVIVLTKSGETLESVYLVEQLQRRNCEIWLLSFNENSKLYQIVKIH